MTVKRQCCDGWSAHVIAIVIKGSGRSSLKYAVWMNISGLEDLKEGAVPQMVAELVRFDSI